MGPRFEVDATNDPRPVTRQYQAWVHERESPCLPRGRLRRSKSRCVWFRLAKPVTARSNGRFAAAILPGSVTGRSETYD
jgi:hypothetical protein